MQKSINIGTRFQWKIVSYPKDKEQTYMAVCERLNLTAEAFDTKSLIEMIQAKMQSLFLELYYFQPCGVDFFKHAWDHSIEFKVDEGIDFLYVVPGPIIVE